MRALRQVDCDALEVCVCVCVRARACVARCPSGGRCGGGRGMRFSARAVRDMLVPAVMRELGGRGRASWVCAGRMVLAACMLRCWRRLWLRLVGLCWRWGILLGVCRRCWQLGADIARRAARAGLVMKCIA